MDPWGIPEEKVRRSELAPSITTYFCRCSFPNSYSEEANVGILLRWQ